MRDRMSSCSIMTIKTRAWFVVIALALTGCIGMIQPRMLTAAELDKQGTRGYSADVATGMKAATVALRTLGFEITAADPGSGLIKTAPRDMVTTASSTTLYSDEL